MVRRSIIPSLATLLVLSLPPSLPALTNNLALTPPMGWNDWNSYHCNISESAVTNNAGVIVANGMKAAGYQYVDIDDGWAATRDANGVIQAYNVSGKFPDGIKWLAAYVHGQGLKLGIYTDDGTNTCSSCIPLNINPAGKDPGSYLHEYVDAMTYGSWNVDYLKDDNCNAGGLDGQSLYGRMSDGLMKSGRPILFCLCGGEAGNSKSYQSWSPTVGNYWRSTGDIGSTFASMISHIDPNSTSAFAAGPGRWNDPDMMEIGNGEFASNLTAAQTHFTMWCIMAAPLIAGNNLTTMSAGTLQFLTNAEAIAVDQDPAGEQGTLVDGVKDSAEVWSKPLGYDFTTHAVALLNRATNSPAVITCNFTNLAFQVGTAVTVRDLWAHTNLGTFTNSFTATVPAYGSMLLKITGTPVAAPGPGTNYLSDLHPVYAYTGWGTIVKDKSIGGNTITLGGTAYPKGIGVNSRAGSEYNLGGICRRFQATVGIDAEEGTKGSVMFEVFADGALIYNSGPMPGGGTPKTIDLDVTGVRRLTLGVDDDNDGNSFDHADWANALVTVTNIAPQPPEAPTGLTASPGNAVTLNWNPTLAAITYNVKRAAAGNGPFVTITNVPITTFTDTNVTSGATYYYVVSAVGSLGEGSNSVSANATICNLPAVPTNVVAAASNSYVQVTWNASAGAASYAVSRFTGTTPPVVITNGLTATNFTDWNVSSGTSYYYQVTAANVCNASAPSGFAAATPGFVVSAAPVWNGGSVSGNNWSDAFNWNDVVVQAGNSLIFDGIYRTDNTNDTAANTLYTGLTFSPNASAFVLNGNPIQLNGGVTNNSPWFQVVNLGFNFSNNISFSGTSNQLMMAGGLTNTLAGSGATTLTLAGAGQLMNQFSSTTSPGGTNIITLNDPNGDWTLVNNASLAAMTVPWVFSINSGTFNFGSSSSFPVLNLTTPNNAPTDNQVGTIAGGAGTFNLLGGTLTTVSRFNTATALNSTGIVNQAGGTFNMGSQFQGANGGNAGEMSIVNLSGGTMSIAGGGGPFYVASRGGGTLNLSNGAILNCSTLDVSRNAAGNSFGSTGVVNLNGGVILCSKVGTATSAAQTGMNGPTAQFNFNGGTLRINSSTAPFFQGSTVAPVIPITAVVRSGGAIVDSNGRTNTFAEPLLHDAGLGATPDGGLTKNGAGCLVLVSNVSYTGGTLVNAGILALSNGVSLDTSSLIYVGDGAVLDASGRSDQTLTLLSGQELAGAGVVNGNTVAGAGSVIAPGAGIGTLAFNNNLTLNGGSTIVMAVNKGVWPSNDVVQVAGSLQYGGTLVVSDTGAIPFAVGDNFKLFNAPVYSGAFVNISPAIPGIDLAWNTNNLSGGVLSVVSSPTAKPVIGSTSLTGSGYVLRGTNGVPNWPCYVMGSTNLSLPPDQWSMVATGFFNTNGIFDFTNSRGTNSGPQFFRLQLH